MTIRHTHDGAGTHYFLREDGSLVIRIYLPPKLTKPEKINAMERLIAFAVALVSVP